MSKNIKVMDNYVQSNFLKRVDKIPTLLDQNERVNIIFYY